ncbi:MAG TPA: hypothetical protein VHS31_05145 [Tepidisphaeraceae bacterium]|jgi:hypothetical protein|nr:hypothetical protein [Tepidisphaeraceae bacterium]
MMQYRYQKKRSVLLTASIATIGASVNAAQPSFQLVPKQFDVPGVGIVSAVRIGVGAISADGSTLTGIIRTVGGSSGNRAYYYQINQSGAIPFVLNDPNYGAISAGLGISDDGSLIFGNGGPVQNQPGPIDPDVWDQGGNGTVLPIPDGAAGGEVYGSSPDHTIFTGSTDSNADIGFAGGPTIWVNNQPRVLTSPGAQALQGIAYAAANDASTVDFYVPVNGADSLYYRWSNSGVVSIPNPIKSQPIWVDAGTIHTSDLGDQNLDDFLLNHGFPVNPQGTSGQPDYVPGVTLTFGATAFAVHNGRIILAGDYGGQNDSFLATLDVPSAPTAWNQSTGGTWGVAANWTQELPTGDGEYATLGNKISADATISLAQDTTIGHLFLNSSNHYTLQGPGTLHLQSALTPEISDLGGNHTINVPITVASDLAGANGTFPSLNMTVTNASDTLTIAGPSISFPSNFIMQKLGDGTLQIAATTDITSLASLNVMDGALRVGSLAKPDGSQGNTRINIGGTQSGRLYASNIREPQLVMNSGTVRIDPNGTAAGVSRIPSMLAIPNYSGSTGPTTSTGGTQIDLTNNALITSDFSGSTSVQASGGFYKSVTGAVSFARNSGPNGLWTGSGITSSTAAANPNLYAVGVAFASKALNITGSQTASFMGQTVNPNDVLVRLTYNGDANLDGKVNLLDLNALATNFGSSNRGWVAGDFNYDLKVNLLDFNMLAANFNASPLAAPTAPLGALVPEPMALGATALFTLLATRRRNARSKF